MWSFLVPKPSLARMRAQAEGMSQKDTATQFGMPHNRFGVWDFVPSFFPGRVAIDQPEKRRKEDRRKAAMNRRTPKAYIPFID